MKGEREERRASHERSVCINRNLILSRKSLFVLLPSTFVSLPYFFCRALFLILRSLFLSPSLPILYLAFSNSPGSSLLPSGEIYKAVERRAPLKSRQSVDFCRSTELETSLSLSLSLPPYPFLFLSVARLTCALSFTLRRFFFFFFSLFSRVASVVLSSLCIQPFRASSPTRKRVYLVNARM